MKNMKVVENSMILVSYASEIRILRYDRQEDSFFAPSVIFSLQILSSPHISARVCGVQASTIMHDLETG